MWALKRLFWALVLLGAFGLILHYSTGSGVPDTPKPEYSPKQPSKDALHLWLDKLETYEKCPPEGIIDNNNKRSYSCLCFQMETFQRYFIKYYGKTDIEKNEWLNLISDCELQKEIAYKMIKESWNNWKHWSWSIVNRGLAKPPLAPEMP